jgi:membrane-bound serine protease (ClpP class)
MFSCKLCKFRLIPKLRVALLKKYVCLPILLLLLTANAQTNEESQAVVYNNYIAMLTIDGGIGVATTDYIVRSMEKAEQQGAVAILIKIDTPGGLDAATRDIIKVILASKLPVITFVHPAGGRAASAGTYILYASHIAAMAPSTTLGAATPVSISVPEMPSPSTPTDNEKRDSLNEQKDMQSDQKYTPTTTMERKVVNDAVAFIRALANRHGRNEEWAEKAVRQAATLTASEALQLKVIDIVAIDTEDLLLQINQREVQIENKTHKILSKNLNVVNYDPDWRNNLLAIITDPQIAYILLMIGIYGLVLEGYNPGALVPGVIGGICLITAFYALQVLPVNYAGLALIILGVLLIVAETMAPSLGILGIGGVMSLTLGSIMLIDSDIPGMEISDGLIGGFSVVSALIVLMILVATGKSLRMKRIPIEKALLGKIGTVESFINGNGFIHIAGELWTVKSDSSLEIGQRVQIISQYGLLLTVEPARSAHND